MIQIEIDGTIFSVFEQNNLLTVLRENGFEIDAPCSGNGKCGKCVVKILKNAPEATDTERTLLGEEKLQKGMRLACMVYPVDGMQVRTIRQDSTQVEIHSRLSDEKFAPYLHAVPVKLQKPVLGEVIPYDQNLIEQLKEQGVMIEHIPLDLVPRLMELVREKKEQLCAVVMGDALLDLTEEKDAALVGMAVDIGTTTVVAHFFDMKTGKKLYTASGLNRQRSFGADVISRINLCLQKKENLTQLQKAIAEQINGFITAFEQQTGWSAQSVYGGVVAANTTMLHLLTGIDPCTIANAPFVSGSHFGTLYPAKMLGISVNNRGAFYLLPSVSAYVGGDIVSGLVSCDILKQGGTALFVDIGTNGEMAALSDGVLHCCSVAAGPAFEGAQIKCGVGGIPGAISKVWADADGLHYKTIADQKPVGICGSGLVDAIAAMLKTGVVDETGRLCDQDEADESVAGRIDEDEGEFVLDAAASVVVSKEDVRQVQLAKAAVAAGIETLLKETGLSYSQVDKLYLAGGFGFYLDPESAGQIGLLPQELVGKIEFLGNSSCDGAAKVLLTSCTDEVARVQAACRYIELSSDQEFQDAYIENMMFE